MDYLTNYGYSAYGIPIDYEEPKLFVESSVEDEFETLTQYHWNYYSREIDKLIPDVVIEEHDLSKSHLIEKSKAIITHSQETLITPDEESFSVDDDTSSFDSIHPCLRNIDISDSQLKLANLFRIFPIPPDPGVMPAFWIIEQALPIFKPDGIQKFKYFANKLKLRPINSMENLLQSDIINLRYYGIDPRIVKVICLAVENNTSVQTIDLKDNQLSAESCEHLSKLLIRNELLSNLKLSGCRIGTEGIEKLSQGITSTVSLKYLDVSHCEILDEGLDCIATAMSSNISITNINLMDNRLTEKCAKGLKQLILESETLEKLNLSWNSLYTANLWKNLVEGLKINKTLTNLNLSWNALDTECVSDLTSLLILTKTLDVLDVRGNRFNEKDAISIGNGLTNNTSLSEVYLGDNPLRSHGAFILITSINLESKNNRLSLLNLENVWITPDIIPKLELIKTVKPELEIVLGGIFNNPNS